MCTCIYIYLYISNSNSWRPSAKEVGRKLANALRLAISSLSLSHSLSFPRCLAFFLYSPCLRAPTQPSDKRSRAYSQGQGWYLFFLLRSCNIYVGGIRDSVYVPAVCAPSLASRPLAHSTSSSRISYTSFELASSVCLCRKPFLLLFLSFHISYVHICETLPVCVRAWYSWTTLVTIFVSHIALFRSM